MPKPSPAKKSHTKKSAKSSRIKRSTRVLAKKARTGGVVRKATDGTRSSLTVHKRVQPSQSNRIRSVGKLTSRDSKPRQPKVNPVRTASVKQYEAAVKLLYSHEYEKAKVAFEKVIAAFVDDKEV